MLRHGPGRHAIRGGIKGRAERAGVRLTTLQYQENKKEILEKLGSKCSKCGISDWRVLQIDHINGGGKEARAQYGVTGIYNAILRDTSNNYQLLCANCHQIKHFELLGYLDSETPYKKELLV